MKYPFNQPNPMIYGVRRPPHDPYAGKRYHRKGDGIWYLVIMFGALIPFLMHL